MSDTSVLVIGAGASGAALSWRLSQAGIKVICLEQGDWVKPEEIPSDRPDWERARMSWWSPYPNARGLPQDYPIVDDESPIKPLMFNGVGGSTIIWSGFHPRFHPDDFRIHSVEGVGDDWPLTYDELEPYYDLADRVLGVSGVAGDPSVPMRAKRPMPPLPLNRGAQILIDAFEKKGWHWWPADMARNSIVYDGRAACNHCGACEMGCRRGAKGGVELSFWPAAVENGAELRTGARVSEIIVRDDGRVTGALYIDRSGATQRVTADAVVLAANGIGTPRLLLHSRSSRFPDGLANGSGLVGRNLMFHPIAAVTGVFDRPFDPTGGAGVSFLSNEFYGAGPNRDFARGYMLAGPRVHGPLATALGAWGQPIRWGAEHHKDFDELFGHCGALVISCEDLAHESNCVTLDPDAKDGDGIPAPRIAYAVDDNSRKMIRHAIDRGNELWEAAGAARTIERPLIAQAGFHLMGTARMGDDSSRSVVDRWGRAHDAPNLFIIDGSVFVTSAAVNPTPTILALALRTADHMIAMRQ